MYVALYFSAEQFMKTRSEVFSGYRAAIRFDFVAHAHAETKSPKLSNMLVKRSFFLQRTSNKNWRWQFDKVNFWI